jgi:hypothetical protein
MGGMAGNPEFERVFAVFGRTRAIGATTMPRAGSTPALKSMPKPAERAVAL